MGTVQDLKPYPAYKPSGVDWLGEVPAHWEVKRLGYLATKFGSGITPRGGATVYQDFGVPFLRSQNIHFDGLRIREVARITPSLHRKLSGSHVKPGDVLLNITGASIGRVCSIPDDFVEGNVNQHVCIIRPDQSRLLPGLLAAYLSTPMMQREIQIEQNGASREGLTLQSIRNFSVIVPPLPEQTAIARYLDHADRRIQRYIQATQKRITLLHEARQATIHRAVTRGLNPDVPLKPSGVEWLGNVPAHWDVRRLRTVGEAIIGLTYSPQDVVDEEEGTIVLRASNISEGRMVYGDNVFVRCSVPDRLVTQVGDILICSRSGSRALIGKNARIDSASTGITFGAFMTIFRSAHNDYLHHVFNSKLFEYQSGAFLTSTINQLTLGILYNFKIPWPPAAEQTAIAAHLNKATAAIDAAIDTARRQTEHMQEYRASLIAHVVTGKLDVRAAAERIGMATS